MIGSEQIKEQPFASRHPKTLAVCSVTPRDTFYSAAAPPAVSLVEKEEESKLAILREGPGILGVWKRVSLQDFSHETK